jgi:hypothetical protein
MKGFPFGGNGEYAHAGKTAGAAPGPVVNGEADERYLGRWAFRGEVSIRWKKVLDVVTTELGNVTQ